MMSNTNKQRIATTMTGYRSDENILRTNFPLGDRLYAQLWDDPNQSSTGIFLIGSGGTFDLPFCCEPQTSLYFQATYFHNGEYHVHPYTFRIVVNSSAVANNTICAGDQEISGTLSMVLCLKRLRDFSFDDFKRHLDAVNDTLESGEASMDFHQFFIFIKKTENNQRISICCCNQSHPLHLPTIIYHRHTLENTMIRERYKGENRVGKIQCEFKLIDSNPQRNRFRLALFLVGNKYPLSTNNCRLNLTCELKTRAGNEDLSTVANGNNEQYSLNHPAGMVIVDIYGPNLQFLPSMIGSKNTSDYVRPVNVPDELENKLRSSQFVVNSTMDVSVMNKNEYSLVHKNRQADPIMKPYIPLIGKIDASKKSGTKVQSTPTSKTHKRDTAQLVLSDNTQKKTFSERHVRILACGISENGVVFVETVCPPLRDTKLFPPLKIKKILANNNELRAEIQFWIYCEQDVLKSKNNFPQSPFGLDFFFMRQGEPSTEKELTTFSRLADLHVETSYVPDCPNLLSFQMPDRPEFDGLGFCVRLHHMRSFDYNPSALFRDETVTIYRANSVPIRQNNSNSADFNDIDDDLVSLLGPIDPVMSVDQMALEFNTDEFYYVSNTPSFPSNGQ